MRLKKFEDFKEDLFEYKEWDYESYPPIKGKTGFTRWLRGMDNRLKTLSREARGDAPRPGEKRSWKNDTLKQSKEISSLFPNMVRLITGSSAAIIDFFTPSKKGTKLSKKDLRGSKKKILDDWESNEFGSKNITDSDAEKFYKSGVVRGKKYFGADYNPTSPKNKDEEAFSEYLGGAMERYYHKIHKDKK
jgi:hypothetical protein